MTDDALVAVDAEEPRPWWRSERAIAALMALAFVGATLSRGTDEFLFDARSYWDGARSVIGSTGSPEGFFGLRGVLTAFVYLPAALGAALLGEDQAGWLVLFQNSVAFAGLGVVLVPALVGRFRTITPMVRATSAVGVWVVCAGFAPYPLIDVYAAACCLGAIVVATGERRTIPPMFAGFLVGVACNLRPAYLVTAAFIVVAWVLLDRRSGAMAIVGIGIASVPQLLFNAIRFDRWSPLTVATDDLVAVQTQASSYTVRYDTVLAGSPPRLFHCSPEMATRVTGDGPETIGGLAHTLVTNVPSSIVFVLEKVAAALYWPVSAPYFEDRPWSTGVFALVITSITVLGVVVVGREAMRGRLVDSRGAVGLGAVVLGGVVTLMTAATESRFALPLVLVGVVGVNVATVPRRSDARWLSAVAVAVVAVLVVARFGLAHPAPAGGVDPRICAGR